MISFVVDDFMNAIYNIGVDDNEIAWQGIRDELKEYTEDELVVLRGKLAALYELTDLQLSRLRT